MITLAQVVKTLPSSIQGDFDCPDRGPHLWRSVLTNFGETYMFCIRCTRRIRPEVDPLFR